MFRLRRGATLAVAALVVAGCGGSASAPPVAAPAESATVAPSAVPEEPSPEQIAFVDSLIGIAAIDSLDVVAGETIDLDVLVHNESSDRSVLRFSLLTDEDADFSAASELSASTLQVDGSGVTSVSVTVVVPDDAEPGAELSVGVLVLRQGAADERASASTTLRVVESVGERPVLGDDTSSTATNERVLAYVVGDDVGISFSNPPITIVGGAFRAASVAPTSTGFIDYEPFENLTGPDAVLYEICNDVGGCDTAILRVDVIES